MVNAYVVMREEMVWYVHEIFSSLRKDECRQYLANLEQQPNCIYWIEHRQFPTEQDAVNFVRSGDTLVWEVYFNDSDCADGWLRYDEPLWIFAAERPPLTWIKWNNPYAGKAGTVYVPYDSHKSPEVALEIARSYVPSELSLA